MYRSYCAIVRQNDRTWTFLSSREHLNFACAFFQASLTGEARSAAITSLLERTGLVSCADLNAGTDIPEEMGPAGLSGGQRRRLSLAVALAKKPSLLIADEPTSGLDAAAATGIMKVMADMAKKDKVAVLCTIHQPGARVFQCIDQLLVLSKGCTVYLGLGAELAAHTASLGKPVPPGVSTSEHMLNLANADFSSDESVNAVIDAWQKKAPPAPPPPLPRELPAEPARAPFMAQAALLFERHALKLLPRDPLIVILIVILCITDISTSSLYFWNEVRTDNQDTPENRTTMFMVTTQIPLMFNIFYCIGAGVERVRVQREINNGMYSPGLYVFVTSLIALPATIVTGCSATLLSYVWGDYHSWASFGYSCILMSATVYWMAAVGMLLGWLFGYSTGPSIFTAVWLAAFSTLRHSPIRLSGTPRLALRLAVSKTICSARWHACMATLAKLHACPGSKLALSPTFRPPDIARTCCCATSDGAGFFIDIEDVWWPLRTVSYVTPIYFSLSGSLHNLLGDADDIHGAVTCDSDQPGCSRGFKCSGGVSLHDCVGVTGEQVLQSLHARLGTVIELNNVVFKHLVIICAQSMAIKLLTFAILRYQSRVRIQPSPPSAAESLAPLENAEVMAGRHEVEIVSTKAIGLTTAGENGVELVIDDVTLQLDKVNEEAEGKFLLKNVSASCRSGEIMSIMGPSGAGKSTLLNVLSCTPTAGRTDHITGGVALNGQQMTQKIFSDHCAFMPQDDAGLFAFLSAEAHIQYAVALYRGKLSTIECTEVVDGILARTGLQSCRQTRAGSIEYPGLSGGQRRRLSLALALSNGPSLIVTDEPTTGLDDAAAAAIMKMLRDMAFSSKLAVLATIHQPSNSIFSNMGTLLLLSRGRTAYYGQASDLLGYANSIIGQPVPMGVSIAEHMLNLVNADFASDAEVEATIDAWEAKAASPPPTSTSNPLPSAPVRPPFLRVFGVLLQKMASILFSSPAFFRDKVVVTFVLSTLSGMYLVKVHDREQDVAATLYYGVYFIFSNVMFLNIAILHGYCSRFPAFERELKATMYGPIMYWLVSSALAIVVDMIAAVVSVVPISLFMNVPASSYFGIICLSFGCFSFLTAAIEWFALSGLDSATFLCAQLGAHLSFSANAYLNAKEIIWPFRIFYYILPSHYFFDSAVQLSFGDENAHWNGAHRVSSAPESILNSSAGREALHNGDTFVCPDTPGNCYGDNGRDVLASLAVCAIPPLTRSPNPCCPWACGC